MAYKFEIYKDKSGEFRFPFPRAQRRKDVRLGRLCQQVIRQEHHQIDREARRQSRHRGYLRRTKRHSKTRRRQRKPRKRRRRKSRRSRRFSSNSLSSSIPKQNRPGARVGVLFSGHSGTGTHDKRFCSIDISRGGTQCHVERNPVTRTSRNAKHVILRKAMKAAASVRTKRSGEPGQPSIKNRAAATRAAPGEASKIPTFPPRRAGALAARAEVRQQPDAPQQLARSPQKGGCNPRASCGYPIEIREKRQRHKRPDVGWRNVNRTVKPRHRLNYAAQAADA